MTASPTDQHSTDETPAAEEMISVRGLWKIFGPREHRIRGTPAERLRRPSP